MNADIRARWFAALRSGEYRQAQGRLRDGDAFCCLGVCATVFDSEGWQLRPDGHWFHQDREETLSPRTLASIGLTNLQQRTLIDMNDDGYSFPAIADWIEQNIPADPDHMHEVGMERSERP